MRFEERLGRINKRNCSGCALVGVGVYSIGEKIVDGAACEVGR
jgi:hypothetical protein